MKKIASVIGAIAAVAAVPAVASAQTITPLNTTFNVSGTADLSHSVSLSCVINSGDIKVTSRSTPSGSAASVSGVANPFKPLLPCGAVSVPSYSDWKFEILSGIGGTYSARIFVRARTITGSICAGWINGTFTNGTPSNFTGSGVIPVVSGPTPPTTCNVSVNLNVSGATVTP